MIEVLAADRQGESLLQRWAAQGLPVPPSWCVDGSTAQDLEPDELVCRLRALPRMFPDGHYWVLHQGAMSAESQRESLLNLDSDQSLAAALLDLFGRETPPDQIIIQALPRQQAAGVLFTRHPLRQDLPHRVVEGVVAGQAEHQRLIFDGEGTLVYRGETAAEQLDQVVPPAQLLALADQLRYSFERPQAGEWVHDGERLWLLQTLPVGSLPLPREAWTRRAASLLFNQAVTPLWYTLAGRWFKTGFWGQLLQAKGRQDLARVEPYRRQHSHLYTNSDFFRQLLGDRPGSARCLPPAWQPLEHSPSSVATSAWQRRRQDWRLTRLERAAGRWRAPPYDHERVWRSLMTLDRLGERLARCEGDLAYIDLPDALIGCRQPLPLSWLLRPEEQAVLDAVVEGDESRLSISPLRPGADPVHAPLHEQPAQLASLRAVHGTKMSVASPVPKGRLAALLGQARRARELRFSLGGRLREMLTGMAAVFVDKGLLSHPDDVFFLYFDELWTLWMTGQVPASAAGEQVTRRKVRYLEEAHTGAPDWKMDGVGFGFGGGDRTSPLLHGSPLHAGRVTGPLRRLCSAWGLNRLCPGDIVVVDQVDPGWVPWLAQAGGLVITEKDPLNAAAALAVAAGIPGVWGMSDVMHSIMDGQSATLDGGEGVLDIEMEAG